jgi:hypothetical protein
MIHQMGPSAQDVVALHARELTHNFSVLKKSVSELRDANLSKLTIAFI